MIKGGFVPDEDVRGGCDDEVYEEAEDPISITRSKISFRDCCAHSFPLRKH